MMMNLDFMVAGRTRNIPRILEVCAALKSIGRTYYCFAENEDSHREAGFNLHDHPDNLANDYESRELESDSIRTIFESDLAGLKAADIFRDYLDSGSVKKKIAYGKKK